MQVLQRDVVAILRSNGEWLQWQQRGDEGMPRSGCVTAPPSRQFKTHDCPIQMAPHCVHSPGWRLVATAPPALAFRPTSCVARRQANHPLQTSTRDANGPVHTTKWRWVESPPNAHTDTTTHTPVNVHWGGVSRASAVSRLHTCLSASSVMLLSSRRPEPCASTPHADVDTANAPLLAAPHCLATGSNSTPALQPIDCRRLASCRHVPVGQRRER